MKFLASAGSTAGLLSWGAGSLTGVAYSANPTLFGGLPRFGPAKLTFSSYDSPNGGVLYFKGGVCVDNLLDSKEKELLANSTTKTLWHGSGPSKPVETLDNKFVNPRGKAEGCAAVSWNKETWRNGSWKASIKQELVYKKGSETLIFFMFYDPQMVWYKSDWGIFALWRMVYIDKSRNKAVGTFTAQHVRTHMPKDHNGGYWGAFDKGYIMSNQKTNRGKMCKNPIICIEGEESQKEFKWTWEKHDGGKERFVDWSSNFSGILDLLIKDPLDNLNEFKKLAHERGTWTER